MESQPEGECSLTRAEINRFGYPCPGPGNEKEILDWRRKENIQYEMSDTMREASG
jgi:hypothetical protein